jgi:hypothetical protein
MTGEPKFLYDGRQFLGEIRERRDGRFEATASNGIRLGVFNTPNAAASAILVIAKVGAA